MITSWNIYWLTRLDAISDFFALPIILFALGSIALGIAYVISIVEYDKELGEKVGFAFKLSIIGLVATVAVSVFIPSTKEMAAIIVLPAIANNTDVQEIGAGITDLAKEWLRDLKEDGKEKD